jgi:hypothetical protein
LSSRKNVAAPVFLFRFYRGFETRFHRARTEPALRVRIPMNSDTQSEIVGH